MKKYNVVFKSVFTEADTAQMHDLMKKDAAMGGRQYDNSFLNEALFFIKGCKNLPPSEQETFRNLRIKQTEHNERVLMPKQE